MNDWSPPNPEKDNDLKIIAKTGIDTAKCFLLVTIEQPKIKPKSMEEAVSMAISEVKNPRENEGFVMIGSASKVELFYLFRSLLESSFKNQEIAEAFNAAAQSLGEDEKRRYYGR
jgi:hypothetical protein